MWILCILILGRHETVLKFKFKLTCKLWLPILRSTRPRGRAGPPRPGGGRPAEQPAIKQILFISTKIILLSSVLIRLSDLLGSVPVLVQQPRQHLQQGHGGGDGDVDIVLCKLCCLLIYSNCMH